MSEKLTYCFDLDGTLCTNTFGEYENALPIFEAIKKVNDLYDFGHTIKIFTARGTGSGLNWQEKTEKQLNLWGIRYHELILGKPEADFYIDDRGIAAHDFTELIPNKLEGISYVYSSLLEASNVMLKNTMSAPLLLDACEIVTNALQSGNKIMWCGNGGSASDSQHLAAELVGRFAFNRPALASIALTTDSSILTALGNDFGYETVFERQVEALGKPGDVLIGITTSGSSPNVVRAMQLAHKMGISTVAFTGQKESPLDSSTITLKAPSLTTSHIQEVHITWGQIICGFAEKKIFIDQSSK
jgi:D-sedoheptulose 7-phosphate isomerase